MSKSTKSTRRSHKTQTLRENIRKAKARQDVKLEKNAENNKKGS